MSVGGIDVPTEIDGVPVLPRDVNSQLDQDAFLKLLITSLGNQDPLNPISNEDFIAQQATFTQLEQQIQLNENFDRFLGEQETIFQGLFSVFGTLQSAGFLGKEVEFPSDTITIENGEVDQLFFNVAEGANVGYEVKNSAGNVLRTVAPQTYSAGDNYSIEFDGKDDFGQTLADGNYTVEFNVTSLNGDTLTGSAFARRVVTAVDYRSGNPVLKLENGETLTLDQVLSINNLSL